MPDTPKHTTKPAQVTPVTAPTVHKDDGVALASMILGITSITFMGIITGIPAVILGAISLKNPATRAYSLAGIITGSISILFTILFVIFIIILIAAGGFSSSQSWHSNEYPPMMEPQQL